MDSRGAALGSIDCLDEGRRGTLSIHIGDAASRFRADSEDYTAATTPASLAADLPPQPPSPYRPQAQRRFASILPALFTSKAESERLRDPHVRQLREAHALASAAVEKTHAPVKLPLCKARGVSVAHAPLMDLPAEGVSDKREEGVRPSVSDDAMHEYHFLEAQRNLLSHAEEAACTELHTAEELAYTRLLLSHLDTLALITAGVGDARMPTGALTAEAEELQAGKQQRAQERRALLDSIAQAASDRLAEERVTRRLSEEVAALMPLYETGRRAIHAEEADALLAVFALERRHRPLGPGCFITAPVEDPRLRYVRRVKRSKFHRSTTTEKALKKLRSRSASGRSDLGSAGSGALAAEGVLALVGAPSSTADETSTALVSINPPNSSPESAFAVEGRERFQQEKSAKYAALIRARAAVALMEEEETARAEIQRLESEAMLPLMRLAVDGVYAARRAARLREMEEAAAYRASLAKQIARREAMARVLAAEFLESGGDAAAFAGSVCEPTGSEPLKDLKIPSQASCREALAPPEEPCDHKECNEENESQCNLSAPEHSCDFSSMMVNPGDLPSVVVPCSPMSPGVRDAESGETASVSLVQARAALTQYLHEQLWANDLLVPEAAAALLASRDNVEGASAKLLLQMASARADVVSAQIEAFVDLCLLMEH